MRTHPFAGLAAALLALALPGLARAQSVPPKYLPPDTEVLVTVNLQQILNSEVAKGNAELLKQGKFLLENKLQETGADKYLAKAGIDLFRDVRNVTLAGPGTKQGDKGVVIVEGTFSPEKLQAAAEDAAKDTGAITVTKDQGQTVYEIPQPDGKTLYVGAIGNDVLIGAMNKDLFGATTAQARAGKAPKLGKAFTALLKTTNDKQSLSFAATGPAVSRLLENAPGASEQAAAFLKNVDGISLAFTLAKDVKFLVGITTTDKETADTLSKVGNNLLVGLRGMVAQKAKEDPKFVPAVEVASTLRITAEG